MSCCDQKLLKRACVHIVRSLMESLKGYMEGIIDFMTGIALFYESEKRTLPYYLQLHFHERKVNINWEHRFNPATKLQVQKGRRVLSSAAVFISWILKYIIVILCVTPWPYMKLLRLLLYMLCSCQLLKLF